MSFLNNQYMKNFILDHMGFVGFLGNTPFAILFQAHFNIAIPLLIFQATCLGFYIWADYYADKLIKKYFNSI